MNAPNHSVTSSIADPKDYPAADIAYLYLRRTKGVPRCAAIGDQWADREPSTAQHCAAH